MPRRALPADRLVTPQENSPDADTVSVSAFAGPQAHITKSSENPSAHEFVMAGF